MSQRLKFSQTFISNRIDREGGVIHGVAVISVGPALGHGMDVDALTLEQVKLMAGEYTNGLKVKMTHDGDAGDIVGYLNNFSIDGNILRADFHILKSSPHREYIIEIAETIPDTFGMSISFKGPVDEINGRLLARCTEIYSCDLVGEPAANPSGLFSVGEQPKTNSKKMEPDEIKKIITECMAGFEARLSKLETPVVPDEEKQKEESAMSAKIDAAIKLAAHEAALATIKQFNLSAPTPAPASATAATQDTTKKSFEVIMRELKSGGMKHNDALKKAMSENEQSYKEYQARVQSGEVIAF